MSFSDRDLIVALDLMGGDYGPSVTVPAAKQALLISESLKLILVGVEDECRAELRRWHLDSHERVEFIPFQHFSPFKNSPESGYYIFVCISAEKFFRIL